MKKLIIPFVLIAFLTCACLSTPEQVETLRLTLKPLVDSGQLTQVQADELVAAFSPGYDWEFFGSKAIETALTLALGYLGIRQWRGSPVNRKGVAPTTPGTSING